MTTLFDTAEHGAVLHTYELIRGEINRILGEYLDDDDSLDNPPFVEVGYSTLVSDVIQYNNLVTEDLAALFSQLSTSLNIDLSEDNASGIDDAITFINIIEVVANLTGVLSELPEPIVADEELDEDELEFLGVLFLPSLEEHGRSITIHGVSITEAETFATEFTARVLASRKTKNHNPDLDSDEVEHIEFVHNVLSFKDFAPDTDLDDVDAAINALSTSFTPKVRGQRALFVSANVIGVGTTIIYNKNWATINYSDDTLFHTVLGIATTFA